MLLGCALALDSFSICVADSLFEPSMTRKKKFFIVFLHALMQGVMPLLGYFFVRCLATFLPVLLKITPFLSFFLLSFIGGKMIYEVKSFNNAEDDTSSQKSPSSPSLTLSILLFQGLAASVDALSVGFTIARLSFFRALSSILIIVFITMVFCIAAFYLGGKVATRFRSRAQVAGGVVLILIGCEILISFFFNL